MPKSYKVGDTTYQFPDDFDDAKVQGILTQQGVIKSQPDQIDQTKAAFEAQAPMSLTDKLKMAGSQALDAVNPVNWVKGLAGITDTVPIHQGGQGQAGPGLIGSNPLEQAQGNAIAAVAAAKGTPRPTIVIPATMGEAASVGTDPIRAGIERLQNSNRHSASPMPQSSVASNLNVATVRKLYDAYEQLTSFSPRALLKKGFKGFLDYLEEKESTPSKASSAAKANEPGPTGGKNVPRETPVPQSTESTPTAVPEEPPIKATPPSEIESALQQSLDAIKEKQGIVAKVSENSPKVAENSPSAAENSTVTRTKGTGQAMRDATAMVDKLVEWKFTPDQVKGNAMNAKSWAKLAYDAGVPVPTTAAAKARVWEQLSRRLAGPTRTVQDLISGLKESLQANP